MRVTGVRRNFGLLLIACREIARTLKNDDKLNDIVQRAIARWVVQNLREDKQRKVQEEESPKLDPWTQRLEQFQQCEQTLEEDRQQQAVKRAARVHTQDNSDLEPVEDQRDEDCINHFEAILPNHNRFPDIIPQHVMVDELSVHDTIEGGIAEYQDSANEYPASKERMVEADQHNFEADANMESDLSERSEIENTASNDEDDDQPSQTSLTSDFASSPNLDTIANRSDTGFNDIGD